MTTEDYHILLVEDEADSRDLVQELLAHQAIDCIAVPTAEAALAHLAHHTPGLILIDLALPGMDGWTLLHRLQDNPDWRPIPRVAMTAYHTVELADKAVTEGFTAYFAKPLDAASFANEVMALIAHWD